MLENEFRRPVSIDIAPEGSVCEWCGKPAVYQITAIGSIQHNEQGFFCDKCGVQYIWATADSLNRIVTEEGFAAVS